MHEHDLVRCKLCKPQRPWRSVKHFSGPNSDPTEVDLVGDARRSRQCRHEAGCSCPTARRCACLHELPWLSPPIVPHQLAHNQSYFVGVILTVVVIRLIVPHIVAAALAVISPRAMTHAARATSPAPCRETIHLMVVVEACAPIRHGRRRSGSRGGEATI